MGDSCPGKTGRPSRRLGCKATVHVENGTRRHLLRWRLSQRLQTLCRQSEFRARGWEEDVARVHAYNFGERYLSKVRSEKKESTASYTAQNGEVIDVTVFVDLSRRQWLTSKKAVTSLLSHALIRPNLAQNPVSFIHQAAFACQ